MFDRGEVLEAFRRPWRNYRLGAAAALGVQRGIASRNAPIAELQALLRRHDAIIPPERRPLPAVGPDA